MKEPSKSRIRHGMRSAASWLEQLTAHAPDTKKDPKGPNRALQSSLKKGAFVLELQSYLEALFQSLSLPKPLKSRMVKEGLYIYVASAFDKLAVESSKPQILQSLDTEPGYQHLAPWTLHIKISPPKQPHEKEASKES